VPRRRQPRVLELLTQHGRDTSSFQVLEPGLEYWFDAEDACVAYADTGDSWVAAGGPIAPSHRVVAVMERFAAAATAAGRRPRFFGIERDVSGVSSFRALHIGEQPVWNPQRWGTTLAGARSLREQLRRARAKGVRVRPVAPHEVADPSSPLRCAIDRLLARWLATRAMPPLGFVARLHLYNLPGQRMFFVAAHDERIVGLVVGVPVFARRGWFLEDVVRDPPHPTAPSS